MYRIAINNHPDSNNAVILIELNFHIGACRLTDIKHFATLDRYLKYLMDNMISIDYEIHSNKFEFK